MFLLNCPVCDSKKSNFCQQVNTRYKMNEIVNKFLLAEGKFIPKIQIVLVDHLQKAKKEHKNLKKQEIHDILIKTN